MDQLQQFTLAQDAVTHSPGLCVERAGLQLVHSGFPLVLAKCNASSPLQAWVSFTNGSITNTSAAGPHDNCIAWNVANNLLATGNTITQWGCRLTSWDEQFSLPRHGAPGLIKAQTSTGAPSRLCVGVVSNTAGRWAFPWLPQWSLSDY
jgi:hypothetical protein